MSITSTARFCTRSLCPARVARLAFAVPPARFSTSPTTRAGKPSSMASNIIDTVKNSIGENFGGTAGLSTHSFKLEEVPQQDGKVAVITGGSEGIGYACTHTLLARNIKKVYMLSPRKEVVDGAKKVLAQELGQEAADKIHWFQCDMADWPRVAEIAEQIKKESDRVDILINNAARGIMTYELTDYGVDRHMAVNQMGHDILTSHLLPLMKSTVEKHGDYVRIANMSSNAHPSAPSDVKFDSLDDLNQDLGPLAQYGRAKLALILNARYLARKVTSEYPKILANAAHPGFVSTKMSKEDIHEPYPLAGYGMSALMEPFKKDQFEGCLSIMFCATKTEKSGEYICPPCVPEAGSEPSQDAALGDQMMKLSRELVMEKTKSLSKDKGCPFKDY